MSNMYAIAYTSADGVTHTRGGFDERGALAAAAAMQAQGMCDIEVARWDGRVWARVNCADVGV